MKQTPKGDFSSVDALKILRKAGYKIIIHTSRLHTPELEQFLKDNDVSYDAINENLWHKYVQPGNKRKVIADIYIDDRAIGYRNDWEKVITPVVDFLHKREDVNPNRIALSRKY